MSDSIIKKLSNYYGIGVKTVKGDKEVIPVHRTTDKSGKEKHIPTVFPTGLQKFWQWWLSQNHDSNETLKGRFDRYDDIDFMIYNDGIMSMVSELYADEATQADSQDKILTPDSKNKKVTSAIEDLLLQWDYSQSNIRNHCYNIPVYGDSFGINSIDLKGGTGIYNVEHVDVRDVMDRIEFRISDVKRNVYKKRKMLQFANREPRLTQLANLLTAKEQNYSQYFKSYLFGYQIDKDLYLPPWNVTHYRMFTTKSEFRPWGRSLFVNSIGLFRQLKSSKNLMALARVAKFPKEIFNVKTDSSMTEADKWDKINEAREEWHNMGLESKQKDQFSAGGEIWTADDLLSYDLKENRMDLGDIKDIELLRDEMIVASRVPKGYMITDRGWGVSGQSLLQQYKPFGRAVYTIQSAFLHELVQSIRIHFMVTGQFEGAGTEFTLAMNYPVTEESSDRLRAKQDTLRLANDVVSNIQSALGTRDGLPPDVITSIFSTLSFLPPEDVKAWVDQSYGAIHEGTKLVKRVEGFRSGEANKLRNRLTEDAIRYAYSEALKKRNFKEGVMNHRHIVNSVPNISPEHKLVLECLGTQGKKRDKLSKV